MNLFPCSSTAMADASPLCGILTAEEFQTLNDQTRLKLEEYLRKTDNDSSQLKIQLTKLKAQSGKCRPTVFISVVFQIMFVCLRSI